jgi:hypothetical protein
VLGIEPWANSSDIDMGLYLTVTYEILGVLWRTSVSHLSLELQTASVNRCSFDATKYFSAVGVTLPMLQYSLLTQQSVMT